MDTEKTDKSLHCLNIIPSINSFFDHDINSIYSRYYNQGYSLKKVSQDYIESFKNQDFLTMNRMLKIKTPDVPGVCNFKESIEKINILDFTKIDTIPIGFFFNPFDVIKLFDKFKNINSSITPQEHHLLTHLGCTGYNLTDLYKKGELNVSRFKPVKLVSHSIFARTRKIIGVDPMQDRNLFESGVITIVNQALNNFGGEMYSINGIFYFRGEVIHNKKQVQVSDLPIFYFGFPKSKLRHVRTQFLEDSKINIELLRLVVNKTPLAQTIFKTFREIITAKMNVRPESILKGNNVYLIDCLFLLKPFKENLQGLESKHTFKYLYDFFLHRKLDPKKLLENIEKIQEQTEINNAVKNKLSQENIYIHR